MRYEPLDPKLYIENRARLTALLPPKSVAIVNANDIFPANADATYSLRANSDLFYLTGIEQEETLLILFPDADDEKLREILLLREPNEQNALWEGHKFSKDEAKKHTGITEIKWTQEFDGLFRRLALEAEHLYINTNEHKRAPSDVETRDDRFIRVIQRRYPLHNYRRLAPLLHKLRLVKSPREIAVIQRACDLTAKAFKRVLRFTKPGRTETDIEAECAHEFIRGRGRFAYEPIIAAGKNACCLHYSENSAPLKDGQLMLLDVGAAYANYNSDMTRTIPVNGRFTRRQRALYNAVLRVLRDSTDRLAPGVKYKDWQKAAEAQMSDELLAIGLLKPADIRKQTADKPAVKKYFMHGLGHPIGLDVHDVDVGFSSGAPLAVGSAFTIEPGIYVRENLLAIIPDTPRNAALRSKVAAGLKKYANIGVRVEDDYIVTATGFERPTSEAPRTIAEIEKEMARKGPIPARDAATVEAYKKIRP